MNLIDSSRIKLTTAKNGFSALKEADIDGILSTSITISRQKDAIYSTFEKDEVVAKGKSFLYPRMWGLVMLHK